MTATIVSEPLTYDRHARASWFKDLFNAEVRGDPRAIARLGRHTREMEFEFETRAPNQTQGQGGYFSPPAWLISEFKTAARPKRVLTNLIPTFPLPVGFQSVNLPKLTTGTNVGVQSNNAAAEDRDVVDAAASSQVATIAGNADYSLQSLEQSPLGAHLDFAIFKDLTEAYDAQLETQALIGTGGSGPNAQLNGVVNIATGAGLVTYTDATPTLSELYPFLGQAAAAVGDNRNLPPEAWLMRTARWSWIATSLDNQQRPIVPPATHPRGDSNPQPEMISFPVLLDDAIPANLGAGQNQDIIISLRYSGFILLEGEPRTAVMMEPLSGTLGVRFQYRSYAALVSTAYTSAVATVSGSGMVVQPGF